ncbi:hypothetical protein [Ferruginivarius sediminum]|uniref:Uncharacterized protein n=1 Tax=Ferruginivarius sediminum TaxID=2661937 RepID=A0A369T560_9PROT|nr:hypothetical protein [Ferruginivarius sediminum]RDD60459.1 hypothetical protein DRB17_17815 [Ferruginivarius sediminum]
MKNAVESYGSAYLENMQMMLGEEWATRAGAMAGAAATAMRNPAASGAGVLDSTHHEAIYGLHRAAKPHRPRPSDQVLGRGSSAG